MDTPRTPTRSQQLIHMYPSLTAHPINMLKRTCKNTPQSNTGSRQMAGRHREGKAAEVGPGAGTHTLGSENPESTVELGHRDLPPCWREEGHNGTTGF